MTNVPGAIYRCEVDAAWTMLGIGDDIERITGYPASDFIVSARRSFSSIIDRDGHEWLDGVIFDVTDRRAAEEALRARDAESARIAELQASRSRIIAAAD